MRIKQVRARRFQLSLINDLFPTNLMNTAPRPVTLEKGKGELKMGACLLVHLCQSKTRLANRVPATWKISEKIRLRSLVRGNQPVKQIYDHSSDEKFTLLDRN